MRESCGTVREPEWYRDARRHSSDTVLQQVEALTFTVQLLEPLPRVLQSNLLSRGCGSVLIEIQCVTSGSPGPL